MMAPDLLQPHLTGKVSPAATSAIFSPTYHQARGRSDSGYRRSSFNFCRKNQTLRNSDIELRLTNAVVESGSCSAQTTSGTRPARCAEFRSSAPIGTIMEQPPMPVLNSASASSGSTVQFERTTLSRLPFEKVPVPKSPEDKDNYVIEMDLDSRTV
jgi:hypothetical protein